MEIQGLVLKCLHHVFVLLYLLSLKLKVFVNELVGIHLLQDGTVFFTEGKICFSSVSSFCPVLPGYYKTFRKCNPKEVQKVVLLPHDSRDLVSMLNSVYCLYGFSSVLMMSLSVSSVFSGFFPLLRERTSMCLFRLKSLIIRV